MYAFVASSISILIIIKLYFVHKYTTTNLDKTKGTHFTTKIQHKINIISTKTTSKYIKSYGFKSQSISQFTKFKEILDGRVKTLHPKIHASLIFKRKMNRFLKYIMVEIVTLYLALISIF